MTKQEEILQKLIDLKNNGDIEAAHCEADDLLCQLLIYLGHSEIVDAFNELDKWYA